MYLDTEAANFNNVMYNDNLLLIYQESIQFNSKDIKLQEQFDEIDPLFKETNTRKTRSLVLFIGTRLSYLFGVSTEKDVNQLKDTISSITDSQNKLVHNVKDSISIINVTHDQVQEILSINRCHHIIS